MHGCRQAIDGKSLIASNVTVHDNTEYGLAGDSVKATNVVVQRSRRGILASVRAQLEGGTVSDNDLYGVTAGKRISVRGTTIADNRLGVRARSLAIRDADITGNAVVGAIAAMDLRLLSSTVIDNGFAPEGNVPPGTDVYSDVGRIVAGKGTVCGKSAGPNGPLGVCAND